VGDSTFASGQIKLVLLLAPEVAPVLGRSRSDGGGELAADIVVASGLVSGVSGHPPLAPVRLSVQRAFHCQLQSIPEPA